MSVSAVNNTTSPVTTPTTTTKANDALGKDDFLKILVTQLEHQDPTKPMDDSQFIAEMAQFSSLEDMQNMSQTTALQQAMLSIGSDVKASVASSNGSAELVYGKVNSVQQNGSDIYLTLDNGRQIKSTDVQSTMNFDGMLQDAQSLAKKNVYLKNSDGSGPGAVVTIASVNAATDTNGSNIIQLKTSDGQTIGLGDIWNVTSDSGTL